VPSNRMFPTSRREATRADQHRRNRLRPYEWSPHGRSIRSIPRTRRFASPGTHVHQNRGQDEVTRPGRAASNPRSMTRVTPGTSVTTVLGGWCRSAVGRGRLVRRWLGWYRERCVRA
jgi:hypothetical protein